MTQEDYKLWTNAAVTYTKEDWSRIVDAASSRLASFLCLETLPAPIPDDLAQLLANFICGVIKFQGDFDAIDYKSVRNFTIRFRSDSAVNAFAQIAQHFGDVIDRYSKCDLGFKVEQSTECCERGRYYDCI